MKVNKITYHANAFPEVLRNIPDPPKELYVLGDLGPLMDRMRLGVVGSRKVSPYGRAVTSSLAGTVAGQGIVIVSGLALGVDAVAHQAAIDAGGVTIAVLPCGLDNIYPATNRQLAMRILQTGGVLVSEYSEGVPALQHHFIARNRIVSGLSDGLLITEAAEKSGTLHTAGFALEQGKTVMAVPGNITSEQSAGTNNLIRTGATPITSAEDIIEALGGDQIIAVREIQPANAEEAAILNILKQGITEGTELQVVSQLDPGKFNQTLTMLEISGKIRPTGAGHWTLC